MTRRVWAMAIHASALEIFFSQSFASLRHRFSPAKSLPQGLTGGSLDHPAAGAGLATLQFPRRHHQVMVDRPEQAAVAPVVELTLHRRGWREIVRE